MATAPKTNHPAPAPAADEETASRLRLAVTRLARRLRQTSTEGITSSQMSALSIVDHAGPLTISDLAAIENVQPPTISRIVSSLEDRGWVARVADPADRRVALVQVTPKARRELARLRGERNAYLARRLAALEPHELDAILTALPALERLLDDR